MSADRLKSWCVMNSGSVGGAVMVMGKNPAYNLVNPARDGDYKEGADDCRTDNRQPLLRDEVETAHESYTCRDEKESEVLYKEVRDFIDPHKPHHSQFESCCQQQHSDDARRNRDMGHIDYEFAQSEKREQDSTLENHGRKILKLYRFRNCPQKYSKYTEMQLHSTAESPSSPTP